MAGLSAVFLFEILDNSILNVALATAVVTTAEQLIAIRVAKGVAAAMTTPGSMALAFQLFDEDGLRVRAITLISTVGLVGLAIGPTAGGFVRATAPWQVLLLVNAPIAVLAIIGVRFGVAADEAADLYRDPVDIAGAVLGTATIVPALAAPTLFVNEGTGSWAPWTARRPPSWGPFSSSSASARPATRSSTSPSSRARSWPADRRSRPRPGRRPRASATW